MTTEISSDKKIITADEIISSDGTKFNIKHMHDIIKKMTVSLTKANENIKLLQSSNSTPITETTESKSQFDVSKIEYLEREILSLRKIIESLNKKITNLSSSNTIDTEKINIISFIESFRDNNIKNNIIEKSNDMYDELITHITDNYKDFCSIPFDDSKFSTLIIIRHKSISYLLMNNKPLTRIHTDIFEKYIRQFEIFQNIRLIDVNTNIKNIISDSSTPILSYQPVRFIENIDQV